MMVNILLAVLVFAWFTIIGYVAIRIFDKNFTNHNKSK